METTTLADTETHFYVRTKKSSDRLLAAMQAHHDFTLPAPPPKPIKVIEVPAAITPAFKVPWFSIEAVEGQEPRKPPIEAIQSVVARHYGVSRADILSQRRTKNIVIPRQVAAYLSRQLTPNSIPAIGQKFGGRDHTTILSSIRKIERLLVEDAAMAAKIETIRAELVA